VSAVIGLPFRLLEASFRRVLIRRSGTADRRSHRLRQAEDLRRARNRGFDAHPVKPVDFDLLGKIIGGQRYYLWA
jgi:hypothetical protein